MKKILTGFFDVHQGTDEAGNREVQLKLVMILSEDGFCFTEKGTMTVKDALYLKEKLEWALGEVARLNQLQGIKTA